MIDDESPHWLAGLEDETQVGSHYFNVSLDAGARIWPTDELAQRAWAIEQAVAIIGGASESQAYIFNTADRLLAYVNRPAAPDLPSSPPSNEGRTPS